jgi:hypothetical protein
MKWLPVERLVALLMLSVCTSGSAGAANKLNLFEKPPRVGVSVGPEVAPSTSTLSLVVKIPYQSIATMADSKIPPTTAIGGNGNICASLPHLNGGHTGHHTECHRVVFARICVEVPDFTAPSLDHRDACAGYDWNADIAKSGTISVGRSNSTIEVRQPVRITGRAGVRGALADLFSLRSKSFASDLMPHLNLAALLDANWCPLVTVTPGSDWVNDASAEIVGKNCLGFDLGPFGRPEICAGPINLSLRDVMNTELNKRLPGIQAEVSKALPCDLVRSKVTPFWRPISTKIEPLPGDKLYFNLVPIGAAFSGVVPEDDGVKIALQLIAQTSVGPNAILTDPLPLPPLGALKSDANALSLDLRLAVPYLLASHEIAKNLVGKEFTQHLTLGDLKVRIKDVDVYPSGSSVVVGLKIDADLPGNIVSTSGWVYLVGKPVVQPGNIVRIDDLQYSTVLDSKFWILAQTLFDTQIKHLLSSYSQVDLSKQSDSASQRIVEQLTTLALPGVKLLPQKPTLMLNAISAETDNLSATLSIKMEFELEVSLDALIK